MFGVLSRLCADSADLADLTEDGYTLSGISDLATERCRHSQSLADSGALKPGSRL